MENEFQKVIDSFVIKYQGCLIYQLEEGRYRKGCFVGTLDECKAKIDETFRKMAKTISK